MNKTTPLLSLLAALAATFAPAVELPHVFGDNMVLQRGQRVPVWGTGAPDETVEVRFAGQSARAVVGADGAWRVDLQPLEASAEGAEFRVRGANEIVYTNVVVGEVWFCSGQSNMEYPVDGWRRMKDADAELAAANHPLLRHFRVAHKTADAPLGDVSGQWVETTPSSVKLQSAVAYTFGETLMKELGVPVGLINCSWGGTRIEPWTPAAHPDDLWLLQHLREWGAPRDVPTALWNGMVAGLVPFAIKGAIWYQGCNNRTDGAAYLDKTVALVRGWRREWGQGDFPYFLVQLAPYKYGEPEGTTLAVFQETQARVPDVVPNSGYTVINDVGDPDDIHPTDKRTVGMRVADQVLDRVYGRFVRPWKTPVATGMTVEGGRVRVAFENAEGLATRDGAAPTCFELRDIAGAWVPATAAIEGSAVLLSADGVEDPIGVRFAAYNTSTPNLVNGAGLPAGPFHLGAPCPLGAAEKIPLGDGFTCIQRYDIPVNGNLSKSRPQATAPTGSVARVGYLLELQGQDGDTSFVFADFDAFSPDAAALVLRGDARMPDVRAEVAGLRVRTNTALKTPDGTGAGFVEFYGSNYGRGTQPSPAGGDAQKYDYNDTPQPGASTGPGYGCLQVHDLSSKTTVLAFNHFNGTGAPCDVGIGKAPGEHPDWTFAANAGAYKARRISVWVK